MALRDEVHLASTLHRNAPGIAVPLLSVQLYLGKVISAKRFTHSFGHNNTIILFPEQLLDTGRIRGPG